MTDEQIQNYLNALVEHSLAKGLATPTFRVEFSANSSPSGYINYRISEAGEYKSEFIYGDEVLAILQQMSIHIQTLKSKEEREHEAYLRKVSEAVEYGRKVGIDDSLINPLLEQMKKLSSNIIEHKPQAPDLKPRFDDDIPF